MKKNASSVAVTPKKPCTDDFKSRASTSIECEKNDVTQMKCHQDYQKGEDPAFNKPFSFLKINTQDGTSDVKNRINLNEMQNQNIPNNDQEPTIPKKKKRKRVVFGVMSVLDATQQNSRIPQKEKELNPQSLLQTGDIVLQVNSQKIGGRFFQDACALFGKPDNHESLNQSSADIRIEYKLMVARENKVIKILDQLSALSRPTDNRLNKRIKREEKKSIISKTLPIHSEAIDIAKVPFVVHESNKKVVISGEFSHEEVEAFSTRLWVLIATTAQTNFSPHTGFDIDFFRMILFNNETLSKRDEKALNAKWEHETGRIERFSLENARVHWKTRWEEESMSSSETDKVSFDYVSDAQRSLIQMQPRPVNGCRCGSESHTHVNDPRCFLYRYLKQLDTSKSEHEKKSTSIEAKITRGEKLNQIDNASMQRFLTLQGENKADYVEARFVDEMERLQVSKLKMAVFAPRFSLILVLSSIASLGENIKSTGHDKCIDEGPSNMMNCSFLAKMLLYISTTFGHVYKELSHRQYSWIEECKYHHKGDAMNPRNPDSLSYENIRFLLDEETMERISQDDSTLQHHKTGSADNNITNDKILVGYLVSNSKTGMMNDISYLVNEKMIKIDSNGIPQLSKGWIKVAQPFLLNELWDLKTKYGNKCNIHNTIYDEFSNSWSRLEIGWALNDSPMDIVYYHDEYDRKKELFEDNFNQILNKHEGIFQFGI